MRPDRLTGRFFFLFVWLFFFFLQQAVKKYQKMTGHSVLWFDVIHGEQFIFLARRIVHPLLVHFRYTTAVSCMYRGQRQWGRFGGVGKDGGREGGREGEKEWGRGGSG